MILYKIEHSDSNHTTAFYDRSIRMWTLQEFYLEDGLQKEFPTQYYHSKEEMLKDNINLKDALQL